ncbi:MAG TPA: type II toxin-antitoxin system VapC family toxin [Vicinamibacterales bacterium]|nr:type II toxin-antitoxin system VapC family toxin [Vicinamibacterales bacterium]
MIHIDSSFAIDLLREQRRRRPGPASAWVDAHGDTPLGASVFVWCELELGATAAADPDLERQRVRDYLHTVTIVYPDERFAPAYGSLVERLQQRGTLPGTIDVLIATAALVDKVPIVTANVKHFDAVPGLRVLSYR